MRFVAAVLRRLRWLIALAWIGGAVFCLVALPPIHETRGGKLGALVPAHAAALHAELLSKTRFGFPLLSRTIVVERDPHGLSGVEQARVVARATRLAAHRMPGFEQIAGAIPVLNTVGPAGFARERGTTALTYLFFTPQVGLSERQDLAQRLVREEIPPIPGGTVGVTGRAAAVVAQSDLIVKRLPLVELATCLLVALAVGLRFRAVGAPLMTLIAVGVAFVVATRVVGWVGGRLGVNVPQEVEPVIVVLLFGVVTDYSVFYLSRYRAALAGGEGRLPAAQRTSAEITPIVFAAGITVVLATTTLLAAQLDFLRVFGPGLAFSVLVGLLVAITFIPAGLAIGGRALFWPRHVGGDPPARPALERAPDGRPPRRSLVVRAACRFPWLTVFVCLLALAAAGSGLRHARLANPLIRGLPAGNGVHAAYTAAAQGFAPGILAPTVVVLSGGDVIAQQPALARAQAALARQPGVALVLGPGQRPPNDLRLGATLSRRADAARMFVVLDDDPLGASGIAALRRLQDRLPALLDGAGLRGVHAALAGDTALSAETIDMTLHDLAVVAPLALLAILFVLAAYLRALVAPLYLVAASVAGFAAALGIATYAFGALTYYVPFAAAVLMVSLGSDYNVFLIGRIWQEADRRPLRDAVVVASSRATTAITTAGLVLAGSFAFIALVPVRAFEEIALIMAVGLLIDALLIRTVLVPALVTLVGERSGWPSRRLHAADPDSA